jgi:putative protease
MMVLQLLVNPVNLNNAFALIKMGVHQIFIGIKNFSIHCNCLISIVELKKILQRKNKTKIFININRYFFESEIKMLESLLVEITKLNIDGIIFNDFAIPQILFEKNISSYLIYNPETLVTNFGQFDFYLKNRINEVSISREVKKDEISKMCNKNNGIKIQMQVSGYPLIMHSK